MKIFLCHASEDTNIAEQIQLALVGSRHKVFLDAQSLPGGADFQARIRDAIDQSDAFVFLISPHSIALGKFTLTELQFARKKWPHPAGYVLGVNLANLAPNSVPNYLRAATWISVAGDPAAEVRAAVEQLAAGSVPQHVRWVKYLAGAIVLASLVATLVYFWPQRDTNERAFVSRQLSDIADGSTLEGKLKLAQLESNVLASNSPTLRRFAARGIADLLLTYHAERRGTLAQRELRSELMSSLRRLKVGDLNSYFSEKQLRGLDLFFMDLSGENLRGVSFERTNFIQSKLIGATLDGAVFRGSYLRHADFSNATVREVDFTDSDWFNAIGLTRAQLKTVKVRSLSPCPGRTTDAFREYFDARYAVDFDKLVPSLQQQILSAWASYLKREGACAFVEGK